MTCSRTEHGKKQIYRWVSSYYNIYRLREDEAKFKEYFRVVINQFDELLLVIKIDIEEKRTDSPEKYFSDETTLKNIAENHTLAT